MGLVVGSNEGIAVNKRWPFERFIAFARSLREAQPDVQLLAFQGPQEQDIDYQPLLAEGCVLVSDQTLLTTAAIIGRCDLLVGNDSGLAHVAASLRRPTITLFGPTDPSLIRPWGNDATVLRTGDCPPCFGGPFLERCGGSRDCIMGIEVKDVVAAVGTKLRSVAVG